jgi:MscS family membrane protein
VLGFLRAAEAKDYTRAAQYLDGKRSPEKAEELVVQLKYLLDQGMSTNIDNLSRLPAGTADDQLRPTKELVGTIKTPDGDLDIILTLVKRPGKPSIWLFAQETLNRVPAAEASMNHTDIESYFPAWTRRVQFLSVPLWRWAFVLLSLIIIFIAASLLSKAVIWTLQALFKKRLSLDSKAAILALKSPIFSLTVALMARVAGGYSITALSRHYWQMASLILAWISIAWLVIRFTDILVSFARHRFLTRMQVERATFVSLLGRLFKILVGLILIIALLNHAGVNVSAMVAGLGIGGVALALAAQKTLADLFGGLSIIMRGAVRVGDSCQIDGITGTVEDIGVSSLSLRTQSRSVISIPNSKVAEVGLENFSLRDQFWVHPVFTLRFDTPSAVMKEVLDQLAQIVKSHPEINPHSARARLINLTPTGPQIEVFAYFRRPGADMAAFLEVQEELILKMMVAIEAAGASLSSPTDALRPPH